MTDDPPPPDASHPASGGAGLPPVTRLLSLWGGAAGALGLALLVMYLRRTWPPAEDILRSGAVATPLAAILVFCAGLAGSAWAARGRPGQALAVIPVAAAGVAVAWGFRPLGLPPLVPAGTGYAIAAGAMLLAFPLLITERLLAATPPGRLREAADLRALALVAVIASFGVGLVAFAAAAGLPFTGYAATALAIGVAAIGAELVARVAAGFFLPLPAPEARLGACRSLLALFLAEALRRSDVPVPGRTSSGIGFLPLRSLAYLRAAFLPVVIGLACLVWLLSGVTLVPLDGRAVYERFGAPVAVLHPGLHFGLPSPLGAVRRIEFGQVHDIALSDDPVAPAPHIGAEDMAPLAADRFWDVPQAGDITLAIASAGPGHEGVQSVSADLRLLYRVGLSDRAALASTYSTADPQALVRAMAGRVVAAAFAARTLDAVLDENREAMAEGLRAAVQAELDRAGSGLDVLAVVIEAVHPPAGAADAYHAVRAAELVAGAAIASERGNAIVMRSQSSQYAASQLAAAHATGAEIVGDARAALLRFTADRDAAKSAGKVFLLERYLTDLSGAIGKTPKTIIDHRLNWPEPPVLDLRPIAGALPIGEKGE